MFRVSGLAYKFGLQGFGLKHPTVQGCFLGVVIRYRYPKPPSMSTSARFCFRTPMPFHFGVSQITEWRTKGTRILNGILPSNQGCIT